MCNITGGNGKHKHLTLLKSTILVCVSSKSHPYYWQFTDICNPDRSWSSNFNTIQLYTAKSQYWLHKAGARPDHYKRKIISANAGTVLSVDSLFLV